MQKTPQDENSLKKPPFENSPGRPPEAAEQMPPKIMLRINELQRMFRGEMRKASEENGIPEGYRGVLFHLAHHNGCGQNSLAKYVGIKPSSVSIALDKMERDGYIRREKHEKDQRAVKVFLTEKGLLVDKKNRECIDRIEETVASTLEEEEREELLFLLDKVMQGYCAMKGLHYPPGPPFKEKE